ncbi:MAG TPA: NYN domain-containing protein [Bacillota bacterium]|nr:NYN domain-containing protein [Bacillota bacterium]
MRGLKEIMLVDGYNIINGWPKLKETAQHSLDDARGQLIDILENFQGYNKINIILVFDAHMIRGGQEKIEFVGQLQVVYTKENETADHYIERWTDGIEKNMHVIVASSDALQQTIILGRGAVRMSARELLNLVEKTQREMDHRFLKRQEAKNNALEGWADAETIRVLDSWRKQR